MNNKEINEKINIDLKYDKKDLMKTINNAYFNPLTTMSINNEIIEYMTINDGMFIKIEKHYDIKDGDVVVLKFNYDFFDHVIKIRVLKFKDLLLIDKVIDSTHKYKEFYMDVNEYGKLKVLDEKEIIINIDKLSENYISFNILKKDEDFLLNNIKDKMKLTISKDDENFSLFIDPNINKIQDGVMNYKSELFFRTKEDANFFNNSFIDKIKKEKTIKERQILVDNAIKELLVVK